MEITIPLRPDSAGYTVTIDGIAYRTFPVDAFGNLLVAIGAPFTPTSVYNGRVVVAVPGTRVQLPLLAVRAVSIAALPTNVGYIYLGNAAVTAANGRVLAARESIDVAIFSLSGLWIDASVAGEGISYLAVV